MLPDPLHPAIVHFPIAIAVLLPFAAAAAALAIAAGWLDRRSWALVVLLHGVGAGTAWLAEETGHEQEERVEKVIAEEPIHEHEEAGEWLLRVMGGTLVLTAAGLLGGGAGSLARAAAVAGGLLVLAVSYRTGSTGGALVYEHGAASAYVKPAATSGEPHGQTP
jgi:uncharacterized membrane protein